MSLRYMVALVLLVVVRAGGFSSIIAVVWFRDVYEATGAALVLAAFGIGTVVFPALAGALVHARTLTRVLGVVMTTNGLVMFILPLVVGAPVAAPVALMFLVGATSGAARSLLGTAITFAAPNGQRSRTQSTIAWAANLGAAAAAGVAGLVTATTQQYGVLFAIEGVVLLAAAPIALILGPIAVPALGSLRDLRLEDARRLGAALTVGIGATALMQGLGTAFALGTRHPESYVSAALLNGALVLVLQPLAVRLLRDSAATHYLMAGSAVGAVTAITMAVTDSWAVLGVGWTITELLLAAGMMPTILNRTPARLHTAAFGVVGSAWGITAAGVTALLVPAASIAGSAGGWALIAAVGVALALGAAPRPRITASFIERKP